MLEERIRNTAEEEDLSKEKEVEKYLFTVKKMCIGLKSSFGNQ